MMSLELPDIYFINFINRFDIMSKILYIKYNTYSTNFYKEMYINNILTFNGGCERPGTKNNIDGFIQCFDELIKSFNLNKFIDKYSIPLASNKIITNGSHRLSLCYTYGITPSFIDTLNKGTCYDYSFFKYRKPNNPRILSSMEEKFMDRMALEFCFNINTFKVICLFPSAIGKENNVESILRKNGNIYYKKNIKISEKALVNLTYELYRCEDWIGGFFPSRDQKGKLCYGKDNLRMYIFIPNDKCDVISMKKKIRDLYNIGKHSVHIHDTYEEGLRIAKTLLNNNSIDFLEKSSFNMSTKNKTVFEKFFNSCKHTLDNYCIDSSFVMALYGLREAKDLDYLTLCDSINICNDNDIHNHNSWSHFYKQKKDDIILNPDLHFYYAGIKFATLEVVKDMKINRDEDKDRSDIKLINLVTK